MKRDSDSIFNGSSFHKKVSPEGATRVGPFPLMQIPSAFSSGNFSKISPIAF